MAEWSRFCSIFHFPALIFKMCSKTFLVVSPVWGRYRANNSEFFVLYMQAKPTLRFLCTFWIFNVEKKNPGLGLKMNVTYAEEFIYVQNNFSMENSAWKKGTFTGASNQCIKKHETSLVYITKKLWALYILIDHQKRITHVLYTRKRKKND